MAQPLPIHSWNLMGPWVVSAVKSGATSLIRIDMNFSPQRVMFIEIVSLFRLRWTLRILAAFHREYRQGSGGLLRSTPSTSSAGERPLDRRKGCEVAPLPG